MSGLARLYECVGYFNSFPVEVRAVASLSGLKDKEVIEIINSGSKVTGLIASGGKIHYLESYKKKGS